MNKKILRFTADWCNPCKQLKENIERAELTMPIEVIDIEENEELSNQYGVRNLPTMVLVIDDKEISRMVGVKTPKQIREWAGK
jgi:thioredoxin 1